ncbi:armadillo repeat-containing protein 3 [Lasioglossum baleicum]|uniref:armadillo repeat-containing protein 3 n=1 Tax=Lasioglossum baleicum TaxID=434251 RepID=UPI003FCC40C8
MLIAATFIVHILFITYSSPLQSGCFSKQKRSVRGKERVDREEQSKYNFDPLRLEVKYPGTAILLLKCQEQPVLLAAAAALSKYGSKTKENLEVLFDLDIVESVIPLIEHEDLFIRRFAAKLLAEMILIPNVRNFLVESNYYICYFAKVLISDKDLFMQEFSSWILAEISADLFGLAQLLKMCPQLQFLFEKLQSPDPDVKRNNLQILYNLLQDPVGSKEVMETKNFNLSLVYDLFNSPYLQIQRLALNVIANIVNRNRDEPLQEIFRLSNGLQALLRFLDVRQDCVWSCNIEGATYTLKRENRIFISPLNSASPLVQNDEWQDLHAEVLRVLCLASDNTATVELLHSIGGIGQILKYIEDAAHSKLFIEALDVAVRLTHTPMGRKVNVSLLDETPKFLFLCYYSIGCSFALFSVTANLYEISCHGIGMMTLHNEAAKELTASNCIKNILAHIRVLDILKNESFKWSTRQIAMFALNQLLNCDIKNCQDFLDMQGQVAVSIRSSHRSFFFLRKRRDSKRIHKLNETVFEQSMLKNRSAAKIVPSWNTCIDALFDSHLPIKFAFTGRLSLHDVTQNGFYTLRKNICPFPILDDIFRFQFCPVDPIYVVNCPVNHASESQDTLPTRVTLLDLAEDISTERAESVVRPRIFLSAQIESLEMGARFSRLPSDNCLHDYVELFKCMVVAAESKRMYASSFEKCFTNIIYYSSITIVHRSRRASETKPGLTNVSYVASRARMLAKFVAKQMSGPDQFVNCIDHQLEIHLKEIKETIETSVIPLGILRIGSYLERALLFKVIADRVFLPAALVRGEYGKAWIEIAVPEVSISVNRRRTTFPSKLLKPNFIVDLMHSPGDLIPINSRRARLYREQEAVCRGVCYD